MLLAATGFKRCWFSRSFSSCFRTVCKEYNIGADIRFTDLYDCMTAAAGVSAREKKTMTSILAVDDSPSMRQMVSYALENAGYEVVLASDGKLALEIAEKTRVNLVITDVNMPNMDGISLVRQLRKLRDYKFTPILILTTESSQEKKKMGKEAGATGWIVKPFDPDQLLNTLQRVLD
jgi:two-component system chemotaxis response regulator CheY